MLVAGQVFPEGVDPNPPEQGPPAAMARYQFKRGQSGNPGRRSRGLERLIREKAANGGEIVDFVYGNFSDEQGSEATTARGYFVAC